MRKAVFLGFDVGTSASKGVAVDEQGVVLGSAVRRHRVSRPAPGLVEMSGELWWREFGEVAAELADHAPAGYAGIGVSGMGPTVLLTDADDQPLAPAALYGVDTRATAQITALTSELGAEAIFATTDCRLTSQSAGPKLRWFREQRPATYLAARRWHMPASLLVARLTGEYVLDRQSASQATPMYDAGRQDWHPEWAELVAPGLSLPRLAWAGELAGRVSARVAGQIPGLRAGSPVTVGTIDAWAEALSVGACRAGDLMVMYGTTMFLIAVTDHRVRHPAMWGTTGLLPGQWNLAGGLATSGAITEWFRKLFGGPPYAELLAEAEQSAPGANGLLMLPYFAGERTPIQDPLARGTIVGLTIGHNRGDLYRAALEATGYAVRHNVETMRACGVAIDRAVAVGGGTRGRLWPQLVSDITGLPQQLRVHNHGASHGDALLAARLCGLDADIEAWNPGAAILTPQPHDCYRSGFDRYCALHEQTRELQHELAELQERARDDQPGDAEVATPDGDLGAAH